MNERPDTIRDLITTEYAPTSAGPRNSFYEEYRSRDPGETNIAEIAHENTKITRVTKHKSERSAALFLEDDLLTGAVDRIDPKYSTHERHPLPDPKVPDADLCATLSARRSVRSFDPETTLSVGTLSSLLHYAIGVSEVRGQKGFRRYPSAGGLFPVEPYVVLTRQIGDFSAGLYYYLVGDHALQSIESDGTPLEELFADSDSFDYTVPEITFFLTGSFWRSYAKYGPRAYRYVLAEAGHLSQNLQLVATALGLGSIPRAGYVDRRVNDYLGTDGVNEAVLYACVVGSTDESEDQV